MRLPVGAQVMGRTYAGPTGIVLEVIEEHGGRGVRTLTDIAKGQDICSFGKTRVMPTAEYEALDPDKGGTGEFPYWYGVELVAGKMYVPDRESAADLLSPGPLINTHTVFSKCNCHYLKDLVGGEVHGVKIRADRAIRAGTPLMVDYGSVYRKKLVTMKKKGARPL